MLCEKCGINTATFHYTEVVNGIKSEHHLCKQCVVGTDMSYYTSFFDNDAQFKKLLSGLLASQSDGENDVDSNDPANKVHCPKCGMSYAEFIENSVFGCPDCYDVFGPLISDTIRKIQGSDRHTGKKPLIYGNYDNSFAHLGDADDDSGMEISKEIDVLQKRLKEAVLLEDFDLAANLRDQISELKKGLE